jgi:hypothetical protein
MESIFESLENLNVSEECFNDIVGIVEEYLGENILQTIENGYGTSTYSKNGYPRNKSAIKKNRADGVIRKEIEGGLERTRGVYRRTPDYYLKLVTPAQPNNGSLPASDWRPKYKKYNEIYNRRYKSNSYDSLRMDPEEETALDGNYGKDRRKLPEPAPNAIQRSMRRYIKKLKKQKKI